MDFLIKEKWQIDSRVSTYANRVRELHAQHKNDLGIDVSLVMLPEKNTKPIKLLGNGMKTCTYAREQPVLEIETNFLK